MGRRRRTTRRATPRSAARPAAIAGSGKGSRITLYVALAAILGILWFLGSTVSKQAGLAPSQAPMPLAAQATGTPVRVERVSLPASELLIPGRTVFYGTGYGPEPEAIAPEKPATRPAPRSEDTRQLVGSRRQIAGHKVPLRSEAQVGSALVDRLSPNQVVSVLEQHNEWAKVKVERTQREGWVPTKRIGDEAPATEPEKPAAKIAPALSVAVIAKLLIEASIADYPGPCACPYQHARNGSACGRRAAYVRPGGYAPLCFAKDITPEMVVEYRRTH